MKQYIQYIAFVLGISTIFLASCNDNIDSIIEKLNTNRVFSPTNVTVRVYNKVNARITWDAPQDADRFNLAFFVGDSLAQDIYNTELYNSENCLFADYSISRGTTDSPYIIEGLPQDTFLTVYIQSISIRESAGNSTWTPIYFKTSAENLFKSALSTSTSITVSWEAGSAITNILITDELAKASEILDVTSEEKANGTKIISGLKSDTKYLLKLLNGESVRGTTTVTTKPSGTVLVAGDDINAAIAVATAGDVLLLSGGTYTSETAIKITKPISIFNLDDANRPKLNGILFQLETTGDVTLSGLDILGTGSDESHTFVINDGFKLGNLTLEDCEISNYKKGLIYGNYSVEIESITINDCVITEIQCNGADFVDIRKSYPHAITVTNNTFTNVAYANKRQFIRLDGNIGGTRNDFDNGTNIVEISVANNTFYYAPGNEVFYSTFSGARVEAENNLFASPNDDRIRYSGRGTLADEIPFTATNNFYYGTVGMYDSANATGLTSDYFDTTGTILSADPFANAAKNDFTINANLSSSNAGDPRWHTSE